MIFFLYFGWNRNKGYGTEFHINSIFKHGLTKASQKKFHNKKITDKTRIIIMRFKLFFLASLLIYSCTNSDKEAISLFNFLPTDSKVIININDLNNTKEILNNNSILPIVLSTSKEISNQLNFTFQ